MTLAGLCRQERVVQQAPHAYHPEHRILHPAADNHDDLWRSLYIDELGPASALRLSTPPHVFFSYAMPNDEKIRSVPGVVAVAPLNVFNGSPRTTRRKPPFPRGGTDPDEFLKVYRDYGIPQDQVIAWQKDRAGTIVENALTWQQGWRGPDCDSRQVFSVNLELNIRGSGF